MIHLQNTKRTMDSGPFDLIGDIHGHFDSLAALLAKLGYRRYGKGYRHPARKVIFLGDFIDRGPGQRAVVETVRAMIDAGDARAVMGNHEFNAMAYATRHPQPGEYLRPHSAKNQHQHAAFLAEYEHDPRGYAEVIGWFKTLPIWLDLGGLRVVHACWDNRWIERLATPAMTDALLVAASRKGNWEFTAIDTLLKGKEIALNPGHSFTDKDGTTRHDIRVRWWDKGATTFRQAFMGPESARTHIPEDEIAGDHLVEYSHAEPPVFLGHYWFEGTPEPLATNIACLDYSVAKPGGKLVAYRWDGEQVLERGKFEWVERVEERPSP